MPTTAGHQGELAHAHDELAPEVRDARWTSNCAGEIFVQGGPANGLRIGHFQGDASLAVFVVLAHEAALAEQRGTS